MIKISENKWYINGIATTVTIENINVFFGATEIMKANTCHYCTVEEAIEIVAKQASNRIRGLQSTALADSNTIREQHAELFELKKRVSALEQGAKIVEQRDYSISRQEARALLAAFDSITVLPYKAEDGKYKISRVLYNLLTAAGYGDDTLCELFGVCRAHTAGYGIQSTRLYTDNNEYYFEYKTYNSCD